MILPVSLVIPMLNESATLPALFAALVSQTANPAEVIFVDAGSSDGSPDMVARWWEKSAWDSGQCRVLSRPGALPGGGRNAGIADAGNEWIAFLDAGIEPEPDWLKTIYDYVREQKIMGAYGVCRFSADAPVAKAICALSYGCGAIRPVLPASIFRRQVFDQAGLFVAGLRSGEDILWLHTYQNNYGPRKICWDAVVNYRYFPDSIGKAAKKWFIYEVHAVATGIGDGKKVVYVLFLSAIIGSMLMSPSIGIPLFFFYAVTRGVIDPIRRSADKPWWGSTFPSIGVAFICGPLLDVAKLCGYLVGMLRRVLCRGS